MAKNIVFQKVSDLRFDYLNPRMVEYGFTPKTTEKEIVNTYWTEMATEELVMSILAHGFFQHEPLYIVKENDIMIVVEGNRRLAAVKSILSPDVVDNGKMTKYCSKITPEIRKQLEDGIPVLELEDRKDAWRYIGFKHVNGAAKWGSYAKAQYIATVKDTFGISLNDIAEQIGDTNNTVRKLYHGLLVLRQAEAETEFQIEDTYAKRIYFSHLYSALTYSNIRNYIGIPSAFDEDNPVNKEYIPNLEQLMLWLYGSFSKDIRPLIESQSRDLRCLNDILGDKGATLCLKERSDLYLAYDVFRGGNAVLYDELVKAKLALEKAVSKIEEYDKSFEPLKVSADVVNIAERVFNGMDALRNPQKYQKKEFFAE